MKKSFKVISLLIGILIIAIMLVTISYYSFLFIAHDFSNDFLKIDDCLDIGGRWNYDNATCER